MARFYGHKDWDPLRDEDINDTSLHFFTLRYGNGITLVFKENGVIQHQTYNIKEVRNRRRNGLTALHPDQTFFEIIDRALLIFLKSSKTLVWMSGAAEELELICEKHHIIMIFIEHEDKLKKQLVKSNHDMGVFLDKIKPLPKRLDFRNIGRKKKTKYYPVFEFPPGFDERGWPIKDENTDDNNGDGNIEMGIESENSDEISDVYIESTEINDTGEPETNAEISCTLDQFESIEPSDEFTIEPEANKIEKDDNDVKQ